MATQAPIPVVDLFAGPGGLGEGFAALDNGKVFKIKISAEMEASAHKTLRLRAFFRILKSKGGSDLESYYRFCNGDAQYPWDESTEDAWLEAENEARQITLGSPEGNRKLIGILDKSKISASKPWVLIGGPPCQAYSLVGRSRNKGKVDYKPDEDHRHFLYKEYLKIIQKYQPSVFVMENVKGILSSKVNGEGIFRTILRDLSNPDAALGKTGGHNYRIHSLSSDTRYEWSMNPEKIDIHDFIVRSENFGIPQARHRVILLGVRDDIHDRPSRLSTTAQLTVKQAIWRLPKLRSRISKGQDSPEKWAAEIKKHLRQIRRASSAIPAFSKLKQRLNSLESQIRTNLSHGSLRERRHGNYSSNGNTLDNWYVDDNLTVWLNHEARSHMTSDLRRYLFASSYALAYGKSPKGHEGFKLPGLEPAHKNWKSGKFADRFKVQQRNRPSTTITSHISKDGHYFIHPDPTQCRSLTVREAARLQTFPDNYFFQGNRTQQFHQVGNAVPPLLALKIARITLKLLRE